MSDILDQTTLPYFDQYFKHNDYIQNFELAAAMDISQHRVFDTLMSCIQTLSYHEQNYIFENNGEKKIIMNLDFFMNRYMKAHRLKSIKKSEIRTAIKSLNKISVLKETEENIIGVTVFPYANANLVKNTLEIEISKNFSYDTLIPGRNTKSPGYTKLFNSKQVELKSIYARILYQYFYSLLAFKSKVTKQLEINELYRMLGFLDENSKLIKGKKGYSDVSQFKRRCITESVVTINESTDILIQVTDKKNGKRITGFEFIISKNNDESDEITGDEMNNQLPIFKPSNRKFTSKDEFVTYMKINYKNKKITNSIPNFYPSDCLIIDKNGMLCMENSEKGIYRFSNSNNIDSKLAAETWEWLYSNIELVGTFKHITHLDILNFEFINTKIIINEEIYIITLIEKNETDWVVTVSLNGKEGKMKIPLEHNLTTYILQSKAD